MSGSSNTPTCSSKPWPSLHFRTPRPSRCRFHQGRMRDGHLRPRSNFHLVDGRDPQGANLYFGLSRGGADRSVCPVAAFAVIEMASAERTVSRQELKIFVQHEANLSSGGRITEVEIGAFLGTGYTRARTSRAGASNRSDRRGSRRARIPEGEKHPVWYVGRSSGCTPMWLGRSTVLAALGWVVLPPGVLRQHTPERLLPKPRVKVDATADWGIAHQ